MTWSRFRRLSCLLAAILAVGGTFVTVDTAEAAGTQNSYVAMPHPDDEWESWSLIYGSTSNYKVFIYMTQGEQSSACLRTNQTSSAGPYWYQGPSSPVGQPNYGETLPAAPPWSTSGGQFSAACKTSRKVSTRQFLNDRASKDSAIPSFSSTESSAICFSGNTLAGVPPRRDDAGTLITSNCATYFSSTNGYGKLIFFDLGDGDLTKEEVQWAITKVKSNKSSFGIPTLPDVNAIGAFRNSGVYSGCAVYNHADHVAIHQGLWNYDMDMGRQYGRTCSTDPDVAAGGRTGVIPSAQQSDNIAMSGNTRVGPLQKIYAWLASTYFDSTFTCTDCLFAQTQPFWSRFN